MKKTEPGTRALIREYLRRLHADETPGAITFQTEIAKRIGPGNAVLIDGKIITAHKGELFEGRTSLWIFIFDRIGLDDEDEKMPTVYGPLDNIEGGEDDINFVPEEEEKENKTKNVKTTKVLETMV